MIKRVLYYAGIFTLAFSVSLFTGCDKEDETEEPEIITLNANPISLAFISSGNNSQTVQITTNAESWSFEPSASWIQATDSDEILTVNVEDNDSVYGRSGNITVTAGNVKTTVKVSQTGTSNVENTLSVTPQSLSFEAKDSESQTITVETNASYWSIENPEEWITAVTGDTTIMVSVENNEIEESRTGVITVTAGDQTIDVQVFQEAGVAIDPNAIRVNFTSATGVYYGLSSNYTGKFIITFTTTGNEKLVFEAFSDIYAIPEDFIPADADYVMGRVESYDTYTQGTGGSVAELSGTYYSDDINAVPVTNGTLKLKYDKATKEYTVTASMNGTNLNTESESVTDGMVFKYQGAIVFDNQAGTLTYADYTCEDESYGDYFGDYSTKNGVAQYKLYLRQDYDYETYQYNGFDIAYLYTEMAKDSSNPSIPSGVYRLRDNQALYTIDAGYGSSAPSGSYDYFYDLFGWGLESWTLAKYGTIVIENKSGSYSIKGYIFGQRSDSGSMTDVAFEYNAPLELKDKTPLSTYDVTLTVCDSYFYGDYYEVDGGNYVLYMYDLDEGYQVMLEICTQSYVSYLLPEGNYYPSIELTPYTFIPGYYNSTGTVAYGTVFGIGDVNSNTYDSLYLITGGSANIEQDTNSVYNITGTLYGTDGTSNDVPIKFSYSGLPNFVNKSGEDEGIWEDFSLKSASASNPRPAKVVNMGQR